MSSEDDIEEFRSLLNQAPHEALFARVCKLIGFEGKLSQVQRDYIVGHVTRWPSTIVRGAPHTSWQHSPAYALCNMIAPTSFQVLMGMPVDRLASMDRLDLSALKVSAEEVEALASWEALASVRWLRLSLNAFGDAGVSALLGSAHITQLETLELMGCDLGVESVEAIMSSPRLEALRVLDLRHNAIGTKGAKALTASPRADQLEWIHVGLDDVKKPGVQALVKCEAFSSPLRAYFQALRDVERR